MRLVVACALVLGAASPAPACLFSCDDAESGYGAKNDGLTRPFEHDAGDTSSYQRQKPPSAFNDGYSPYVDSPHQDPNMRSGRRLLDSPLDTPDYRGNTRLKNSIFDQ